MNPLNIISRKDLDALVNRREGETKIGETVHTLDETNWAAALQNSTAQFVLLGIPEDIGVRANHGVGGAHTTWLPSLKSFLNVQETDKLQGSKIAVLGAFDLAEMMVRSQNMDVIALRTLVDEIDNIVYPVIKLIVQAGKIPIVVGGGHNNAYPILKGVSEAKGKAINTINLDAHCDYRVLEGRHSGNGFRYAKQDGYLEKYAMIGLHRNYNSQSLIDEMTHDKDIDFCFYDTIFIEEARDYKKAIDQAVKLTSGNATGIELDLDCIERVLSSAATPCGIAAIQARKYLFQVAHTVDIAYLHLTEGIVKRNDGVEDFMTAKLISYLITDFIRASTNRTTVFIEEA